uniref:Tumor necrosis factor alpha-induced protein 2-like n=1 Tax=Seriola lalandi dorsalis TaxID=1841481 RepID=A0A3B4YSW7_SERLL
MWSSPDLSVNCSSFSSVVSHRSRFSRRTHSSVSCWWFKPVLHCVQADSEVDGVEEQREELLEEVSRKLILREEQLFTQDCPSEDEDQLHKDLEDLKLHIWMAVDNTFTSPSSSGQLDVLRSAMASVQQQEVQDRRWMETGPEDRFPAWRPLRCLSTHNALLQNMVESRLTKASLSLRTPDSDLSLQVCHLGRRVRDDLLTVARTVKDCYPANMDILNIYAALYHQRFSARLTELASSGLGVDDCSYLLFWVNHCYPHTALKKEEESWLNGNMPELIDSYYFSPLAVDVIQVVNSFLTEFTCVIRDQSKTQRITAHLENFLSSYKKSMEEFVRGNHGNAHCVIKAHLVCEEQFRDYITGATGSLSEQQRRRCLETLSALRDCGYRYFTCPIDVQLKSPVCVQVCYRDLWTSVWLDGSLPVVSCLLDSLSRHLRDLTDLKPACRQSLLSVVHRDVVLRYVKRMMKTRMKSREQQGGGAQRMKEDAQMINDFFREGGCSGSFWLGEVLSSIAEVLHLQDPGSVQLEMVSLARTFPDLSDDHVSALLSLKTNLSAADVRSIRKSVEENRLFDVSTNQSPPFFSKVKVKWINNKINKMGL